MKKSVFNLSLAAIIIISVFIGGFVYKFMTERPTYAITEAEIGKISQTINLDAKVEPLQKADLGFELGGKITKLNYQVGDFVTTGTILAEANATDLQASYRQTQNLALSAQNTLEYYEALESKAKKQLKSLKRDDSADKYDKEAQEKQIDANQAQVEAQKQNVAAARAAAEAAKAELAKKIITAPFSGIISTEDAEVGETASGNETIITLISQDKFKLEAYASQMEIKNLAVGSEAKISLDRQPEKTYTAKIIAIDPAETSIGGVSNYKVTLEFSEQVPDLQSGLGASAIITIETKNDAVLVPQTAVFEKNGKKYVYISQNGTRVSQEVQTGIYGTNNQTEIVSGLNAGDKIFELSK